MIQIGLARGRRNIVSFFAKKDRSWNIQGMASKILEFVARQADVDQVREEKRRLLDEQVRQQTESAEFLRKTLLLAPGPLPDPVSITCDNGVFEVNTRDREVIRKIIELLTAEKDGAQ